MKNFIKNRSVLFWIVLIQLVIISLITWRFDINKDMVLSLVARFTGSPFAVPSVFVIYTLGAFINIPQWMLHGASVLSFGPYLGSVLAWAATLVSASVDFWIGRKLGPERVEKISGKLASKLLRAIRKNGFWASLAVRILPTGPFVFVNMAAGVTRMKFAAFLFGTAIGSIPKIALMASLSEGAKGAIGGREPVYIVLLIGLALLWLGILWFAGTKLRARFQTKDATSSKEE